MSRLALLSGDHPCHQGKPPDIMSIKAVLLVIAALVSALHPAYVQANPHSATVKVDLKKTKELAPDLFGIFFEELNNAGEGGLHAELIQDRSFDALAYVSKFAESDDSLLLDRQTLDDLASKAAAASPPHNQTYGDSPRQQTLSQSRLGDMWKQPLAWSARANTQMSLTRENPLRPANRVALKLKTEQGGGGVTNTGFWGIPAADGKAYALSFYALNLADSAQQVKVWLSSGDSISVYAIASFEVESQDWTRYEAKLESNGTDPKAVLEIVLEDPGTILLDQVSLFPAENARKDSNPWPFRQDLVEMMRYLEPKFMRFPGGCYVEGGDHLKNRPEWKKALGPIEGRAGHANANWGYWSTDGLGLYEYMQLCEELKTEPIWVINNGVSHQEFLTTDQVLPWINDTLDSIEFITGSPNSTWGSVRADMGHPEPWGLRYVAIGNEDCGHPYYLENYIAFYAAIKSRYPNIQTIANCNLDGHAPTEIWDWHVYIDTWDMWNRRNEFNNYNPQTSHEVFASEYAVVADGGWGNLKAAIAEAGFMTGLERNSHIVTLASYAPLFVHAENHGWATNLINIDNHRAYGTPSYYVQRLFAKDAGVKYADTQVAIKPTPPIHNDYVAAAATCIDSECTKVCLKVVNFASFTQSINVMVGGGASGAWELDEDAELVAGPYAEAENSFEDPELVSITSFMDIGFSNGGLDFEAPPMSVLRIVITSSPAEVHPAQSTQDVAASAVAAERLQVFSS